MVTLLSSTSAPAITQNTDHTDSWFVVRSHEYIIDKPPPPTNADNFVSSATMATTRRTTRFGGGNNNAAAALACRCCRFARYSLVVIRVRRSIPRSHMIWDAQRSRRSHVNAVCFAPLKCVRAMHGHALNIY